MNPNPKVALVTYAGAAGALGVLWYVGLHLSPMMAGVLRDSFEKGFHLNLVESVILFMVSSIGVAFIFRKQIIHAVGWENILYALFLPFIGALFVILGCLISLGLHERFGGGDIQSAFIYGYAFTLGSIFIVFPLGLVSQFTMRWVGNRFKT